MTAATLTARGALLAASAFAALGLAACGGDDAASSASKSSVAASVNASRGSETDAKIADGTTRLFAASSPWNTRADTLAIDPQSATMLRLAEERVRAVDRPGGQPILTRRRVEAGITLNTSSWTVPIVSGGASTPLVCRQQPCGDGDTVERLRIPENVNPDPRYDGWMTVIEGSKAYDLWRARREDDGSISYQHLRAWDLRGPGIGVQGKTSARGSGLPLAGGVVRAAELDRGMIEHALAISVPGPATRAYVRPASATNGNGAASSLPSGARIRLKDDVVLPAVGRDGRKLTQRQQRMRDALAVALRRYGAIVVDRAAVPTLYVERGLGDERLAGDELLGLTLADFEVTELGDLLQDPPVQAGDEPEDTP